MIKYDSVDIEEMERKYKEYSKEYEDKAYWINQNLLHRISYAKEHSLVEFLHKYQNSYYSSPIKEVKFFAKFSDGDYMREEYILYNKMTEDEMKQYIDLHRESILKSNLTEAKELAIVMSIKKSNVDTNKDIIYEVAELEYQNDKDVKKKENLRECIKKVLSVIYHSGVKGAKFGMGIGFITGLITNNLSWDKVFEIGGIGAIVFNITALVGMGFAAVVEYVKDKNTIEQAKEFGLYEMILDEIKTKHKLNNFIEDMFPIERDQYYDYIASKEKGRSL